MARGPDRLHGLIIGCDVRPRTVNSLHLIAQVHHRRGFSMIRSFSRVSVSAYFVIGIALFAVSAHGQNDDVAALRARGQLLLEQYNYVDAVPIYERLVKVTPDDPVAWRNLGSSLLA